MKKLVKLVACIVIIDSIIFNTSNVFGNSKKVNSKVIVKDINTKKQREPQNIKDSSNNININIKIGSKIANINGKNIYMPAVSYYQSKSNNQMIPLRFILKYLDIDDKHIRFNPYTKTIIVEKENDILEFQNNSNKYKKNGEYIFPHKNNKIETSVIESRDGITFISLIAFEKAFDDVYVKSDKSLKTATITFNKDYIDVNDQNIEEKMELDVINFVNQERAKYGLSKLKIDEILTKAARLKSNDMLKNKYFSHESPSYGLPTDMLKNIFSYEFNGYYLGAGENIATGQTTARQVVDEWLNSKPHKENILNPNYKYIGVGLKGNIWTQLFT